MFNVMPVALTLPLLKSRAAREALCVLRHIACPASMHQSLRYGHAVSTEIALVLIVTASLYILDVPVNFSGVDKIIWL